MDELKLPRVRPPATEKLCQRNTGELKNSKTSNLIKIKWTKRLSKTPTCKRSYHPYKFRRSNRWTYSRRLQRRQCHLRCPTHLGHRLSDHHGLNRRNCHIGCRSCRRRTRRGSAWCTCRCCRILVCISGPDTDRKCRAVTILDNRTSVHVTWKNKSNP